MPWNLKVDAEGKPVYKTPGVPIYVKEDGTEIAQDPEHAFKKIGELTGEAKTNREAKEAAETKLQAFGDLNLDDAKKAIETVKAFNGEKAVAASELDRVRNEAVKAVEDKYKPIVDELGSVKNQLKTTAISSQFGSSKFIKEKIAEHIPADMVQAQFGNNFDVVDGKVVAKLNGQPVYSPTRPGEHANFDEALEVMVGQYAYKDKILKGSGSNGGGGVQGSGSGMQGGKPTMQRTAWEGLAPADQAKAVSTHSIVD